MSKKIRDKWNNAIIDFIGVYKCNVLFYYLHTNFTSTVKHLDVNLT